MGKIILLLLLAAAALTGCKPLATTELVALKVPYVNIGNKYIYYNHVNYNSGVVRCDTIEVIGIEERCVHFTHKKSEYIMDKYRFRHCTSPLGEETKKPHK